MEYAYKVEERNTYRKKNSRTSTKMYIKYWCFPYQCLTHKRFRSAHKREGRVRRLLCVKNKIRTIPFNTHSLSDAFVLITL